ncbi:CPBP family intramembrane metalloprotease [Niabella pedocola]|uniref:CPBP family intramembrane metalloprotease n=1 Tax=Niabella pedocola TaxID=1752077 RepID=A0ABS8PLL2_9BACT|nr:CPBP family intramembrane glutamic endopeptidase [Niabella pedocola]MCD2421133.1 CPBP family intramembrane metalloprotease [Niabella pedocola]
MMPIKYSSSKRYAWLTVALYFTVVIGISWIASRVEVLDSIFVYFGTALLLSYLLLRREGLTLWSLGIKPSKSKDYRQFFSGIALGMIALAGTAGLTIWLNHGKLVFTGFPGPFFLLTLIFMHFVSSFVQEFTYRGYPFQRLLQSYGPWIAQICITLPFAIMHIKLNAPIDMKSFLITWLTTGLGSILYGLCYLKTGKLFLSIGVHMGWNLAQSIIPRSPQNSEGVLFKLVTDTKAYNPVHVLWPYLMISVLLIVLISRSPLNNKPANQNQIQEAAGSHPGR